MTRPRLMWFYSPFEFSPHSATLIFSAFICGYLHEHWWKSYTVFLYYFLVSPLFYLQRYTLNYNCAYICLQYTAKARIILFICMCPTSILNTKSVGNKKRWNETQTQFALSWHKLHEQLRTKILFSHLGENGYMYMYDWVPSLFTWNYQNIVNWLYPNNKCILH